MLEGEQFPSEGVLSALWERFSDGKRIAIIINMNDDARSVTVEPEGAEAFELTLEPASSVIREL